MSTKNKKQIEEANLLEFEGFKFKPFRYSRPSIINMLKIINNNEPTDRIFALIKNVAVNPTEVENRYKNPNGDNRFDLLFFTRLTSFISSNYLTKMFPKISIFPSIQSEDNEDGNLVLSDSEYEMYKKHSAVHTTVLPVKVNNILYLFRPLDEMNDSLRIFNEVLKGEDDFTDYISIVNTLKRYEVTGNLEKISPETFEYYAFYQVIRYMVEDTSNLLKELYEKKN